jgi:tetratricopeptide (TPR) repeat protein
MKRKTKPPAGQRRRPANEPRGRRPRLSSVLGGALLLLPALFSCAGLGDRYLQSLTPRDLEELNNLDLALLDCRLTRDPKLPAAVEAKTKALLEGEVPNKEYKAELLGIMGTALYYKGDADNAARTAALIDRESAAEPRLYTLRALLENDRTKKVAILTDGLARVERKGLLQLDLAELWFADGEYRKALAAYDEAFLALPARYRDAFKKNRDLAFQFMDRPPAQADAREILAQSEITVGDVLTLTARETRFFEPLTADPKPSAAALFPLLQARDFLRPDGPQLADVMARKDIAYFLVHLLALLENDPKILQKYSGSSALTAPSPVPDLLTIDYFYDAALVLVEREIMELPDGKNFFPDKPMSGGEYFEILKKLKQLYR